MKTLRAIFFVLFIAVLSEGCILQPDHSVRIRNEYHESLLDLYIRGVVYGTVASGETTDYKPFDEGTCGVSATTYSGLQLTGTVTIKGNGKHKWTVTITATGDAPIKED
jgi:hypothetical protein